MKNMVFKSYTHELKTPLNGICMSLETTEIIIKDYVNSLRAIGNDSNQSFND